MTMQFAVETWAPDYGTSMNDGTLAPSDAHVDLAVEVPPNDWAPRDPSPAAHPAESVLFVDGVQRIDARVWVTEQVRNPRRSQPAQSSDAILAAELGATRLGVCASWAAGAVRCATHAEVVVAEVRRGVICAADDLEPIVTRHGTYEPRPVANGDSGDAGGTNGANGGGDPMQVAIAHARGDLEGRVAVEASRDHPCELVIVDGPLGDRRHIPGAVGYIKAHHVTYLPPEQQAVVERLTAGQRTPLFRIGDRRFRYSWYLRLPGPDRGPRDHTRPAASTQPAGPLPHPSWGIARCEVEGELSLADAAARADMVTVSLGRFASRPHQDPRAPQNLHPIAGLERQLRHRMGDPALLERALRVTATAGARGEAPSGRAPRSNRPPGLTVRG